MIAETNSFDYVSGHSSTVSSYGFEAIETSNKRKPVATTRLKSADRALPTKDREKLQSTVRETVQNYNVVAWMCRKHLDYTTSFSFKCRHQDKVFNKEVEDFVGRWSRKGSFHVARRHPLRRFLRIAEGRRIIDGDFGILRFSSGLVQGIESDLIKDPPKPKKTETWVNGVRTKKGGAASGYALWSRAKGQDRSEFARVVNPRDLYLHAYYDSLFREDMVRGISPFAAAVNTLRDTHEITDYAKAKHKVAQMFGIVVKQDIPRPINADEDDSNADGWIDNINFEDGPQLIATGLEDEVDFMKNETNSGETVDLLRFLMQTAVLCLDFPVSMLDERETTFFGGRGALMQYLKSTKTKVEDNRELLDWLTVWRLGLAIFQGDLTLPSGMDFEDFIELCTWCPAGVPWWDPSKEVAGYSASVAACFSNFEDVIAEVHGGRHSVFENIDKNAEVYAYAKEKGVPISLAGVTAGSPEPEEDEPTEAEPVEPENETEGPDDANTD